MNPLRIQIPSDDTRSMNGGGERNSNSNSAVRRASSLSSAARTKVRSPRDHSATQAPGNPPPPFAMYPNTSSAASLMSTPATQVKTTARADSITDESGESFQELGAGGMLSNGHGPPRKPIPVNSHTHHREDLEMLALPPLSTPGSEKGDITDGRAPDVKKGGGRRRGGGGVRGSGDRLLNAVPTPITNAARALLSFIVFVHSYMLIVPIVFFAIFIIGAIFTGVDIVKAVRYYEVMEHSEDGIIAAKIVVRMMGDLTAYYLQLQAVQMGAADIDEWLKLQSILQEDMATMRRRGKGLPSVSLQERVTSGNTTSTITVSRTGAELLEDAAFAMSEAGGWKLSTCTTRLFLFTLSVMEYCAREGDIYFGGFGASTAITQAQRNSRGRHRAQYAAFAFQAATAASAETAFDLMHLNEIDGDLSSMDPAFTDVNPSIYRPLAVPRSATISNPLLNPPAKTPFADPGTSLYSQYPTVSSSRAFIADAHATECTAFNQYMQDTFVVGSEERDISVNPRNTRRITCNAEVASLRAYIKEVLPLNVPVDSTLINATNTTTNASYSYQPYTSEIHPLLGLLGTSAVADHTNAIFAAYIENIEELIERVQEQRGEWLGPEITKIVFEILAFAFALIGGIGCTIMIRQQYRDLREREEMEGDFACFRTSVRVAPETEQLVDVISTYLGALNVKAATYGSGESSSGPDGQMVRNVRRAAYPLHMLRPFVPPYMFLASLRMGSTNNETHPIQLGDRFTSGGGYTNNFMSSINAMCHAAAAASTATRDTDNSTVTIESGSGAAVGTTSAFELLNLSPSLSSLENVVHMVVDLERVSRDVEQFLTFGVGNCSNNHRQPLVSPPTAMNTTDGGPHHRPINAESQQSEAELRRMSNLLAVPTSMGSVLSSSHNDEPSEQWLVAHQVSASLEEWSSKKTRKSVMTEAIAPPSLLKRADVRTNTKGKKRPASTVETSSHRADNTATSTVTHRNHHNHPPAARLQHEYPYSRAAALERVTVALTTLVSVVHDTCMEFGGVVVQVTPTAMICEFKSSDADSGPAQARNTRRLHEGELEVMACKVATKIHRICASEEKISGIAAKVSGCPIGTFEPKIHPFIALVNGRSLQGSSRFHVSRHFCCLSTSLSTAQRLMRIAAFHKANVVMTANVAKHLRGHFGVRAIHTFLLWDRVNVEKSATNQFTREAPADNNVSNPANINTKEPILLNVISPAGTPPSSSSRAPNARARRSESIPSTSSWPAIGNFTSNNDAFETPSEPPTDPFLWLTPNCSILGSISQQHDSTSVAKRCVTACELVLELAGSSSVSGGVDSPSSALDREKLVAWNQIWELYEALLLDEKPTLPQMEGVYRELEGYRNTYVSPPSQSAGSPMMMFDPNNTTRRHDAHHSADHHSVVVLDTVLEVAMSTVRDMMGQEGFAVGGHLDEV